MTPAFLASLCVHSIKMCRFELCRVPKQWIVFTSRCYARIRILSVLQRLPTMPLIVVQGAATSVYAATSPQLVGKSGAYLQDCKIAQPNAQAQDAELAKKLWTVTEQQIDEALARIQ